VSVVGDLFAEKPAVPIYHYTSNEGFLGIARKILWASKLHYLNDSTEFAYAIGLAKDRLGVRSEHYSSKLKTFHEKTLESISSIENVHMFVACFSERGDLLSQWRGYCPNQVGYSIAFDREQLEESALRQGFRLIRCEYDKDRQNAIVDELLSEAEGTVDQTSPSEAAKHLAMRISEIAPALKHPQFSEEHEWRLASKGPVRITSSQIRFRPSRWTLIPYYLFELCAESEPLKLSHVYVGPNPHMRLAKDAAYWALWNAGVKFKPGSQSHPPIDVRASSVPYRGL
jgi:hypothetical protein